MAGRKLIVTKKVTGSTIIEVLIAMTIILLVFGIAMMIFGNIMRSSLSVSRLSAESLLRERLLYIEQNPQAGNETITSGSLQIEQDIKPYESNAHLEEVHLVAHDLNNQKAAEVSKVILVP
jgi:Tfp pilus assembly protein PilV